MIVAGSSRNRVGVFQDLVENAPDAMLIVDAKGRIELINAQAVVMFGYPRADLVGRPVEI
jgi:PAS domain S-box-containing protein